MKLKPPTQKQSIFVKNFEIEINAWEDSPSSDLSKTTLAFLWHLFFGQDFRWFSLTSSWKICLFLKKRKMFFVFSRFMIFWFWDKEFSVPARAIYLNFFLFERARRGAGHYRVLFLIKLCFLLYIQTLMWLDTHFWRVFWVIELVISFLR